MPRLSRRDFLISSGSLALAAASAGPARAAMGPNDKFDLVIKNGDVLDPSQSLRGKRDIGIRYGRGQWPGLVAERLARRPDHLWRTRRRPSRVA